MKGNYQSGQKKERKLISGNAAGVGLYCKLSEQERALTNTNNISKLQTISEIVCTKEINFTWQLINLPKGVPKNVQATLSKY